MGGHGFGLRRTQWRADIAAAIVHGIGVQPLNPLPGARHTAYRVGVPRPGRWVERLNTDSSHYGGSHVGTPLGAAQAETVSAHGRPQSLLLNLPPLASVFLEWTA